MEAAVGERWKYSKTLQDSHGHELPSVRFTYLMKANSTSEQRDTQIDQH